MRWVLAVVLIAGCGFTPPTDTVLLPIADRPWAPEAPPEGWCGEASIQMAALYYGAWLPQRHVHALGKPKHVDLWEGEMPAAMTAVGLGFETWPGGSERAYLGWIIDQVRRGRPVIVGVKLLPDLHPENEVDHLMPVVGFTPAALVFNTNLAQGQAPVPYAAIAEKKGVLLTVGAGKKQFGWAVTGFPGHDLGALRVVAETPTQVTVERLGSDAGTVVLPADAPAHLQK